MTNSNKYTADVLTNTNSVVKVPRNTFGIPHTHQTAFNGGKLIPLKVMECYPGDTIKMNMASLVRINSPLVKAPFGEIEFGAYWFKVPMRILLDDFEEIIANYNPLPDWTSDNTNLLPGLEIPSTGGFDLMSMADYLGLPVKVGSANSSVKKVNALPFRAIVKIGDDWFRDEDLMNTAGVNTANVDTTGVTSASGDYLTDCILGGALYPVCKLKAGDPFTTTRPGIQKGAPVTINLGGVAPVYVGNANGSVLNSNNSVGVVDVYTRYSGTLEAPQVSRFGQGITFFNNDNNVFSTGRYGLQTLNDLNTVMGTTRWQVPTGSANSSWGDITPRDIESGSKDNYYNVYHWAKLNEALPIAISDLRLAFQLQKIKELNALYGNRYPEYLRGRWGVRCADGRLQIAEFLGSQKFTLRIQQTIQTSSSVAGGTAQSNISAYSATHKNGYVFETSCTEHCYIICVGCCRIKHRPYSQGIPHLFLNRARDDFYVPELGNISAQPVKNAEICYTGSSSDNENFGYKEAFWWMRLQPNFCTGLMRPNVTGSLAVWNLSDNYTSKPTLSASWIIEDMSALDRCLQIPSTTTPQFLGDFLFDIKATRPIPIHSYPGLVDHQWGYRS